MSPGNSYPHLALTLQPVPLWNHLTVYQQYVIPATNAHTHTHTLSMWHTFCAYFHWHTQHIRTLSLRPAPPNPYTLIPIAESALCIHWLAGQLLERESKTGGRGKMETARHRNIRKRSRQIEKKEKLILGGGTLETDPNWWEDRLSRAGRRVQK